MDTLYFPSLQLSALSDEEIINPKNTSVNFAVVMQNGLNEY